MRPFPCRLVCAGALLFMTVGCAPAAVPDTTVEDTAAVNAVREAWMAAFNAADSDALANFYTEDAIRMASGAPTVTGRAAIRQYLADQFAMGTTTSVIRSDELQLMGDWAFDRGTFTGTMTPSGGGDAVTVEGRYVVILRKQTDGSWKLARAIDNIPAPAGQ